MTRIGSWGPVFLGGLPCIRPVYATFPIPLEALKQCLGSQLLLVPSRLSIMRKVTILTFEMTLSCLSFLKIFQFPQKGLELSIVSSPASLRPLIHEFGRGRICLPLSRTRSAEYPSGARVNLRHTVSSAVPSRTDLA